MPWKHRQRAIDIGQNSQTLQWIHASDKEKRGKKRNVPFGKMQQRKMTQQQKDDDGLRKHEYFIVSALSSSNGGQLIGFL